MYVNPCDQHISTGIIYYLFIFLNALVCKEPLLLLGLLLLLLLSDKETVAGLR